jgi:hypothetical protein
MKVKIGDILISRYNPKAKVKVIKVNPFAVEMVTVKGTHKIGAKLADDKTRMSQHWRRVA